MSRRDDLEVAKSAKSDEFYTSYEDIQAEMNAYLEYNPDVFKNKTILLPCDDPEWSNFTRFFAQNFEHLGLKKLISTSFAADSKKNMYKFVEEYHQFTLFDITDFEADSEVFDISKTHSHGKIFILEKDNNNSGKIDINDLEWNYLEGDGDFRSEEVKKLRDEADIIITNPPFSLFRQFLLWINESNKAFCIIGNVNAIGYKECFPLLKANKMWLGSSIHSGDREFRVPDNYPLAAAGSRIDEKGNKYIRVKGVRWFTNLEHGRRHQPLSLMTKADNLKYSKHQVISDLGYRTYDNYNAIDIPFTDAIPSDFEGVMGVPITFMDKYCPEQFEIVGLGHLKQNFTPTKKYINPKKHMRNGKIVSGESVNSDVCIRVNQPKENTTFYTADNVDGYLEVPYTRVLIKRKDDK